MHRCAVKAIRGGGATWRLKSTNFDPIKTGRVAITLPFLI
jgi:hypothetical protein